MSDRYMIDCTHANLPSVSFAGSQLAAGYVTGSPDVQWTSDDWRYAASLGLTPVTIDQGFTGSPVPTANVRDVESGAWTPQNAVNVAGWTAVRPTIYAARNDMGTVVSLGWKGDIWLAWPQDIPPSRDQVLAAYPQFKPANLVAVQWKFRTGYDESIVYDAYWPSRAPQPQPPGWTETIVQNLSTIAQGASGGDVSTAQGLLCSRGHAPEPGTPSLGIDGIFGPKTDSAVRSFQSARKLAVDGIVGQQTWTKLLNR